jgi:hypothetical protein
MREKKKQTDKRSAALEKKEKEKQATGDVLKTRSQYPVPLESRSHVLLAH